jgi:DNA-nicking Smr family endonuclease
MPDRRLSVEERQLWARVAASVKPMTAKARPMVVPELEHVKPTPEHSLKRIEPVVAHNSSPQVKARAVTKPSSNTLDGTWDRGLSRGQVPPDLTIDLHGDALASAHARLNRILDEAIVRQARLILVITGKPARDNPRLPPSRRGVIRASITDWIAASHHASNIAAIRNAHPRHGGEGALYIILKRRR